MSVLAGVVLFGLVLMLVSLGLAARAHHWARLAERSRIGAQSESQVQQALRTLEREGWQVRHSLPWQGREDIDSVAIAPTGVAFAIETKTKRVELEHLARVRQRRCGCAIVIDAGVRAGHFPLSVSCRPRD